MWNIDTEVLYQPYCIYAICWIHQVVITYEKYNVYSQLENWNNLDCRNALDLRSATFLSKCQDMKLNTDCLKHRFSYLGINDIYRVIILWIGERENIIYVAEGAIKEFGYLLFWSFMRPWMKLKHLISLPYTPPFHILNKNLE